MNHPSKQIVATTILPMVQGYISTALSVSIIGMILRSEVKLSTTYRRLFFLMCTFQYVLQSINSMLTSLPMPKGTWWLSVGNDWSLLPCLCQGLFCVNFHHLRPMSCLWSNSISQIRTLQNDTKTLFACTANSVLFHAVVHYSWFLGATFHLNPYVGQLRHQ